MTNSRDKQGMNKRNGAQGKAARPRPRRRRESSLIPLVQALEERQLLTTFSVTNTGDSGAGSLRQAILDANANSGADTIDFNIGGGGLQTITPTTNLPTISESVVVDGWTQPGFAGAPLILISGAGGATTGFTVAGSNSTLRGLIVNGFAGASGIGIDVTGGSGHKIQGNYIGTDAAGSSAVSNNRGIVLENASGGDVVGTDGDGTNDAAEGNLISGSAGTFGYGVLITASNNNFVAGNTIGLNAAGSASLSNVYGIKINSGSSGNTIGTNADGTSDAFERNLIGGNSSFGLTIEGAGTNGTRVQGNYIGTDAAGTSAIGNGIGVGILAGATNNTVGGGTAAAANVISGNTGAGINTDGASTSNNALIGNNVGLKADLSGSLANGGGALTITNGASVIASGTFSGQVTDSGTLDLNGNGVTINGGLTGTGTVTNTSVSTPSTLTLNGSGTFSGVIQNGANTTALTIAGGTQILTGTNTYTGATTINAGTLQIGNGGASGSLAATAITDNGTLAFNRSGNVIFGASVSGSGTLSLTSTSGSVTQTADINVPSLAVSALAGITLNNVGNSFSSVSASNSTSGTSRLTTTAGTLTIGGISATGGALTVNNTGDISVAGTVSTTGGQAVNLTATGSISETGGGLISTTGTLTTSSSGGTTLGGANALGGFNAGNTTSGAVSLTNTSTTLNVTGIAQSGTAAGSDITINQTGKMSVTGTISTTAAANGSITLTTSAGMTITSGISAGGSGNLALTANPSGTTTGTFIGIDISAATVQSNSGAVTLTATGGTSGDATGIKVEQGGVVRTVSGTGTVSLTGTGGASATTGNFGVYVVSNGSQVLSGGGDITIIGQGGGTGASDSNYGINIQSVGMIKPGGTGNVSLQGTGGGTAGVSNLGLYFFNGFTLTTNDGDISITAQGGPSTTSAVVMNGGAPGGIVAPGAHSITMTGVGAATGGIGIGNPISSTSGPISIISGRDISGGQISTSGTLTTNSATGTTLNTSTVGSFTATNTTSGSISLTNTSAPLSLGNISQTGGIVTINNTGAIVVTGTVSAAGGQAINLTSSGSISEPGAGLINTTGILTTSSSGGTTLGGANTLGGFHATNTTSGPVTLTNTSTTLTVSGITQSGTAAGSDVTVDQTGALSITSAVSTTAAANGVISLTSSGAMTVTAGVTAGGSGNLTLTANPTGLTSGSFTGFTLNSATVQSTTGDVLVQGTGGAGNGRGIEFFGTAKVQTTGTSGTVTLDGTGGDGTANGQHAIVLGGSGTQVSTGGGNVSITGTAKGTGASQTNFGVVVNSGVITAGGSGTMTVVGRGGGVNSNNNGGVAGTGTITSSGGDVFVTGYGGGMPGGASNAGVNYGGTISAGGSGNVTVTGISGASGAAVINSGTFSSPGGNLTVTGSGFGRISAGVITVSGSHSVTITSLDGLVDVTGAVSSGSGPINITAAEDIRTSGSGQVSTTGTLTTNSKGLTLSGPNTVGSLNITNTVATATLVNTASTLSIIAFNQTGAGALGITNTGSIDVAGTVSAAGGQAINLTATGAISQSGSGLISTTGTLTTNTGTGLSLFGAGANSVAVFNATNTTSGNIRFDDAATLSVTGISQAGSGDVTISSTGANTSLTLNSGITGNGGVYALQATGALNVSASRTLDAGTGTIRLSADSDASGNGDDGTGLLTLNAADLLNGSHLVLSGADIDINATASVGDAATTTVDVLSSVSSRPMNLGGAAAAVSGVNFTDAELARILPIASSSATIGFGSTSQTGDVTVTTAILGNASGSSVSVRQSTSGAGKIVLDSGASTTAPLTGGGATVTLSSGSGGVVEAAGNLSGTADFANTATLSLAAGGVGAIGSASKPLQLNTVSASTSNASGNQYINALGAVTFSSINAGTGVANLSGTGGYVLTGSSYSGSVNLAAGTLTVSGTASIPFTIASGATLKGSGTVGAVTNQGTIAPGNSPGILNVGNLNLTSSGNLVEELQGTNPVTPDFDQINVVGTVTLGGTLNTVLLAGFVPTTSSSFRFINNDGVDPVVGTFAGLPQGAEFIVGNRSFQVSYAGGDGNDVSFLVTKIAVTNTADSGAGSLRQAILDANAHAGLDVVGFAVPGSGVQTISPLTLLPTITDSITVDGTTQTGYAGSPLIRIDGVNASPSGAGLYVNTSNSTVKGLIVSRFAGGLGVGVKIAGNNNVLQSSWIGLDSTGTAAAGNNSGVDVTGNGNLIGTNGDGVNDAAERNVIGGNNTGVGITGTNGRVAGNYIGTNVAGTGAVPNSDGVAAGGSGNIIGTDGSNDAFNANERNIISGNSNRGLLLGGGVVAAGNWVGLDINGNALGNGFGFQVTNSGNRIGTDSNGIADAAERNVISGNAIDGLIIRNVGTTGTLVAGNYIGTDPTGNLARPNQGAGVDIVYGAQGTTVGGTTASARNVISGNTSGSGVSIQVAGTTGNVVLGNYIGLNAAGTTALPNAHGVQINSGASGNTIGGTATGAVNIVSGNSVDGVLITGTGTTGNVVLGNCIGTNPAGSAGIPNAIGVQFTSGATGNTIGGTATGSANVIAFNSGAGLRFPTTDVENNQVRGNRTIGNGGLAVDIGGAGSTPNDSGDLDGFTNAPVLTTASLRGHVLTISGFARAGESVDLYLASGNESQFGQGARYLGSFTEGSAADRDLTSGIYASPLRGLTVGTDTTNRFQFVTTLPADIAEGAFITAMSGGPVSEFSSNIKADAGAPFGAPVVDAGQNAVLTEGGTYSTTGAFTDLDSTRWTGTVNFGDGTGNQPITINPVTTQQVGDQYVPTSTGTFDLKHIFTTAGDYTVSITIIDDSGLIGTSFAKVHVAGAPPVVDNTNLRITPSVISENQSVTLTGKFTDDSSVDSHTVQVIWGDGTSSLAAVNETAKTFTATHKYLDNGSHHTSSTVYPVQVTITDSSSGISRSTQGLLQVQVDNVLPSSVQLSLPQADPNEGGLVHLTGTFADPGTLDTHNVTVDWGDGSAKTIVPLLAGVLNFDASHQYRDNPAAPALSYRIHVEVADADQPLTPASADISAQIADVPASNLSISTVPTVGFVTEGTPVTLSGTFLDPGVLDRHVLTVNWGDGSVPQTITLAAGATSFNGVSHVYADNPIRGSATGAYPLTVSLTDPAQPSAPPLTRNQSIVVSNVAPAPGVPTLRKPDGTPLASTTLSGAIGQINEGDEVVLTGSFTDPGRLDRHTGVVNWGDGTTSSLSINEVTKTYTARHTFRDNAVGTLVSLDQISVTISDGDTGVGSTSIGLAIANVAPQVFVGSGGTDASGNPILIAKGTDDGPVDRTGLTYQWSIIGPNGFNVAGSGSTFTFVPPSLLTNYDLVLTATDNDAVVVQTRLIVTVLDNSANTYQIPAPGPGISGVIVYGLGGDDVIAAGTLVLDPQNQPVRDSNGVPLVTAPLSIPVILDGGTGTDTLVGGSADDTVYLHQGNDSGYGRAGNDRYVLTPNSVLTVVDGSGANALDFGTSNFGVTFDLGQTSGQVQNVLPTVNLHYVSVNGLGTGTFPTLDGSTFGDNLTAASNSTISGGGGNDQYNVLGSSTAPIGNVSINGGADADTLYTSGTDIGTIVFNGDDGANTLNNSGSIGGSLIFGGGADADTLINQAGASISGTVTFNGDDGANTLENLGTIASTSTGTSLIFNGGADTDTLINEPGGTISTTITFNGDDGANTLTNEGTIGTGTNPLIFNGGADVDTLLNASGATIGGGIVFNGDDGANTLMNQGTIATGSTPLVFNGGADVDTLVNAPGATVSGALTFNGDDGANVLNNYGTIATSGSLVFTGGADADTLTNELGGQIGGTLVFNGDDGANLLQNLGTIATSGSLVFTGGADADTLVNNPTGTIAGTLTFNGDDGADILQNAGSVPTGGSLIFNGGADADTLINTGTATDSGRITFNGDDGADSLVNLGNVGSAGSLVFTGGADADTLQNAGNISGTLTFNGDDGASTLVNGVVVGGVLDPGAITTLVFTGGADADTLLNPGVIGTITFNGDDGANTLMNGEVLNGTIVSGIAGSISMTGGADADTLLNPGTVGGSITFNGDDGANTLINGATYNGTTVGGTATSITMTGGADADTLSNPGTVTGGITFNGDDGANTLVNDGPAGTIVFTGGADTDLLLNQAPDVSTITFNGDDGANLLVNEGNSVGTIVYTGGADTDVLCNTATDVGTITFNGDDGADTLINTGSTTPGDTTTIIFTGGADADTLINSGSGIEPTSSAGTGGVITITFNGDDGSDTLVNTGNSVGSVVFTGGADTDVLVNSGSDVGTITFNGDDGADVLRNDGSASGTVVFGGGADNDVLVNVGELNGLTFNGDDGADLLANTGTVVGQTVFTGGADTDVLYNTDTGSIAGGLIMSGGADNDTLINDGSLNLITFNGDDGADLLRNDPTGVLTGGTFGGGADTDTLYNAGSLSNVTFNGDDGADVLGSTTTGSMSGVIFNGGADNDTLIVSPTSGTISNITFNGDDGADLLANQENSASNITFNGDAGADRFWNTGSNVTGLIFRGGADADTLVNTGSDVSTITFNGDDGADTLTNTGNGAGTIIFTGGADADTLVNTGNDVSTITFNGDDGADTLTNTGDGPGTIIFTGGADSDTLVNSGSDVSTITFNGDDGADTLNNTGDGAGTINFTGGADTDTLTNSGNDVSTITFNGDGGSNTLVDSGAGGANSRIDFNGGSGTDIFILPSTGSATTVNFSGGGGNDQALIAGSGSLITLNGGIGNDTYSFVGAPSGNFTVVESPEGTVDNSIDTLDFSGLTTGGLVLDLALTTPQPISAPTSSGPGLTLSLSDANGIENVVATKFADTVYGNDRPNTLCSAALDERLLTGVSQATAATSPVASRAQWVLLDFDSYTVAGQHTFTTAERNAIQARIEGNYHGPDPAHPWFNVFFTQDPGAIPAAFAGSSGHATLYFNRTPSFNRPGGEASEVDLGNVNLGGYAAIQVNGLVGGVDQPAATSENYVLLASKIAAHEMGHLMGIRHSDSFGPIGLGLHSPPGDTKFSPNPGIPTAAYETFDHLISSPATVGSNRFNDLRDLAFGPREAIKLAIGDHGVTTPEQAAAHRTFATAQPLALDSLAVPNTSTTGRDAGKTLNVGATLVSGALGIDPATGRSEKDVYSIQGKKGDVLAFEIDSTLLARIQGGDTIDSILRIYDASGNLVPYYGGTAVSDDQFEPTDSLLLDVILPADGTYYVEVDSFSRDPNNAIFDPTNPLSPLNPNNVTSVLNPLNANFSQKLLDNFMATKNGTDTGQYDLLIYRYAAISPKVADTGNYLSGRGGNDMLLGTSGTDTLIGGAGLDIINAGNGGPNYGLSVTPNATNATISRFGTLVGSATFTDPSGSQSWDVTISYGDQTSTTLHLTSLSTIPFTHNYASPGTYAVTITVTNDDGLSASAVENVLVSDQVPVSVSVSAPSSTYNGQAYAGASASVTTQSGAVNVSTTLTYYNASDTSLLQPLAAAPVDAGSYLVVASFAGTAEYLPATSTPTAFSITPATLNVTVGNRSMVFGSAVPSLGGTVIGVFGTDDVQAQYSTTATSSSNVGTYPITATLTGAKAFDYVLNLTPGTLTVTQATPTVSVSAPSRTYNGTSYGSASATVLGVGGANLSTASVSFAYYLASDTSLTSPLASAPVDAGNYLVRVTYPATGNYASATSTAASFSITPATLNVTAASLTKVYGSANPTLTGSVTGLFGMDDVVAQYSTTATSASDVGAYPITATLTGTKAFDYVLNLTPGTLTVTKATPTVTVTAPNRNYDGTAYSSVSASVLGVGGLPIGASVTFTYYNATDVNRTSPLASAPTNIGGYQVVASYAGGLNYVAAVSAPVSFSITANAPVIAITGPQVGFISPIGNTVTFTGSIANPYAGATYSATWTFVVNSGTSSTSYSTTQIITATSSAAQAISTTYAFNQVGVYNIQLTVLDTTAMKSSTTTTILTGGDPLQAKLVIYDPSGGFVTGGGWINSPAGAYRPNPAVSGKASFGFNSKYKKGASIPTGETEFELSFANFEFESETYDWLVVSGAKAQYQGTGQINDAGSYGFTLTLIDGALLATPGPDKLRMKIWDNTTGLVVYDNLLNSPDSADPTTVLGGGQIRIHKDSNPQALANGSATTMAGTSITAETLAPIVKAAIERWRQAGLDSDSLERMSRVEVLTADLDGNLLGIASEQTIWMDIAAAGAGWYVDATPFTDDEFQTDRPSPAGVDLLSVVAHELGHTIGLADLDEVSAQGDIMSESVGTGVRRLPTAADVRGGVTDARDMLTVSEDQAASVASNLDTVGVPIGTTTVNLSKSTAPRVPVRLDAPRWSRNFIPTSPSNFPRGTKSANSVSISSNSDAKTPANVDRLNVKLASSAGDLARLLAEENQG